MPLSPGTRLGPYEVGSVLGSGGMGEVYRARDTRLDRDVAIKVLTEHLAADPEALLRFEREAKAVAALSHPNILAIHDFGKDQGISFAVTEFLEGETLGVRLARSTLTWRKAVEIGVAIAEGLSAAHSKGVVHRDLKPDNIFLVSDGRVKILDFGLARLERAYSLEDLTSAPTTPAKTQPGTVLGTVGYMSPEQVRGLPADARTDIFALGCVLYEMVSGRRAFSGRTVGETMAAILDDDPPALAESGKDIPPELERVIVHCLEKNLEERFQSARDLAFDLKAILTGSEISSPSQRRRSVRGRMRSLAVLPYTNMSEDTDAEYLSDGITESIIGSLSQLPRLRVMARTTVFCYKGREVHPQRIGRELNVDALLTGRVIERGQALIIQAELVDAANGWRLWGEQYNRTLADIFSIQEDIAREICEKLRFRLTGEEKRRLAKRHTENTEAYQLYLKGRYHWNKRTEDAFRKAIGYFEQAIKIDPDYALAYTGLADAYNILGDYGILPPPEAFPKAEAAAKRALELDDALAEAHNSLAYVRWAHNWTGRGRKESSGGLSSSTRATQPPTSGTPSS